MFQNGFKIQSVYKQTQPTLVTTPQEMQHNKRTIAKLKKDFEDWIKTIDGYRGTSQCNTELFKRIIDYHNTRPSEMALSDPEPFTKLFSFVHNCDGRFQLDTFEDLQVLCELYQTLRNATKTSDDSYLKNRNNPAGHIYEALFFKPGWAVEHNEWFLEEIEKLNDHRLNTFKIVGKQPCDIEAECQMVYIEKHMQDFGLTLDLPKFMSKAISKNERLWSLIDENIFSPDKFPCKESHMRLKQFTYFATAFEVLKGKPLYKTFKETYKNALARLLRGDTTLIKPVIDSHFKSVEGIWPKAVVKDFASHCKYSFIPKKRHESSGYRSLLRCMMLSSPVDVMMEYVSEYAEQPVEKYAPRSLGKDTESALRRVDFDHLIVTDPKRCSKFIGLSNGVKNDFLVRASFKYVRDYLIKKAAVFDDLEYIRKADPERFSKLILTGDFLDRKFDNHTLQHPDVYCCGFYADDPREDVTNLERMFCLLPSGNFSYQQALIYLVLEEDMPTVVRERLMERLESFLSPKCTNFKYSCDHYEFSPDHRTDMAEALKDLSVPTLLNNLQLMYHVTYYLFQKIKAGTALADDLCTKVYIAINLLTSRCIES